MNVVRQVRRVVIAASLVLLLGTPVCGCAQRSRPRPPASQARFDAIVARADSAWKAGDAAQAFELYSDALRTPDTTDLAGSVGRKQQIAKRLMLARKILAKNEPSPDSLGAYVQVLQYSTAESTEAVAARSGLAASLETFTRGMRKEVAILRKGVMADQRVSEPATVRLVVGMAEGWRTEVVQAPGVAGRHAGAAAGYMDSAARSVEAAFDRTYAQDVLKALATADKAIDSAEREIEFVRSGK